MENDLGIRVVHEDDLEPADARTPNLTREEVFSTEEVLLVRFRLEGGAASGWHTHGERGAYGVILEGTARFEFGEGGEEAIEVGPEEFFHLPPGTVHRDVNPTDGAHVGLVAFVGPGDPVVNVSGPPEAPADPPPRVAREGDLVPTNGIPGLTRLTPFPDAPVQQVIGSAEGNVRSGWHHHGDNDVLGYVRYGESYVQWGPDDDQRLPINAGDFFHFPAGIVHRDVNPSDGEQGYLLWLVGSEPRTVTVSGPSDGGE